MVYQRSDSSHYSGAASGMTALVVLKWMGDSRMQDFMLCWDQVLQASGKAIGGVDRREILHYESALEGVPPPSCGLRCSGMLASRSRIAIVITWAERSTANRGRAMTSVTTSSPPIRLRGAARSGAAHETRSLAAASVMDRRRLMPRFRFPARGGG